MESEILGFGLRNTAQGIQNPTNDWNPESKFHWQILESSIWNIIRNPESTAWNPEFKTVLDFLTWGETLFLASTKGGVNQADYFHKVNHEVINNTTCLRIIG